MVSLPPLGYFMDDLQAALGVSTSCTPRQYQQRLIIVCAPPWSEDLIPLGLKWPTWNPSTRQVFRNWDQRIENRCAS